MNNILIISACIDKLDPFGAGTVQRTCDLMKQLAQLGCHAKLCRGNFKGKSELSVIVDHCELPAPRIQQLMQKFSQAYAFVGCEGGHGYLLPVQGTYQNIGEFQASLSKPIGVDYTYVPSENIYLYCKGFNDA